MGLTQHGLAESTGVSQSYISMIENSFRTCDIDILKRIASVLGVPLEMICSEPSKIELITSKLNKLSQTELKVIDDLINVILNSRHR